MRRFALVILVGLLTLGVSGVSSLVINEPCTGYELPGSDADCPPTCVMCGCCAQAAEAVAVVVVASPHIFIVDLVAFLPDLPRTDPHDILHVPKFCVL